MKLHYHDYSALLFEEQDLKKTVAQRERIPFNQNFLGATLHHDKFDPKIMQQMRLGFLSSRAIMGQGGGTQGFVDRDFAELVDGTCERMSYDFLI